MSENKETKRIRAATAAARKRQVVERFKRLKGCCDCGYNAHGAALEFDHVNPKEKTRTIASMMNMGWAAIKREMAKCEIRCANCHQIKSVTARREHYRSLRDKD